MKQPAEPVAAAVGESGASLTLATVQAATRTARAAQSLWVATPLHSRLTVVSRARHLLAERADLLAGLAATVRGCPLAEVLGSEILALADALRFLERRAEQMLAPQRLGLVGRPLWLIGHSAEIHREPFGVVLIIAAGNYPLFLAASQAMQALVAGNAVLLKPAPGASKLHAAFAELLRDAGLAPALLTVLPPTTDAAQFAIEAGVDKVVFTGSANTGRKILAGLAPKLIPATLELSGCDPVILREDADLDLVVNALAFGLHLNHGATCIAPHRVFVPRSLATEFEGRLARTFGNRSTFELRPEIARPLLPVLEHALENGAHLLAGELRDDRPPLGPLVLAGVPADSPLLGEDFFAPVLAVVTVGSDAEALERAAQSPYALAASVFSRDLAAARRLAAQINAGTVCINDLIAPTADARLPFGGRKHSGFGTTRGAEGLLELTTAKVITLRRGKLRPHYDPAATEHPDFFRSFITLVHGQGCSVRFKAFKTLLRTALKMRRPTR
jgi:acyl-CoA reductase-like NAD-dependent aldehyde dehydrogenase